MGCTHGVNLSIALSICINFQQLHFQAQMNSILCPWARQQWTTGYSYSEPLSGHPSYCLLTLYLEISASLQHKYWKSIFKKKFHNNTNIYTKIIGDDSHTRTWLCQKSWLPNLHQQSLFQIAWAWQGATLLQKVFSVCLAPCQVFTNTLILAASSFDACRF